MNRKAYSPIKETLKPIQFTLPNTLKTILEETIDPTMHDINAPASLVLKAKNNPLTHALGRLLGSPSVAPYEAFLKFKANFENQAETLKPQQFNEVCKTFWKKHETAEAEFRNNFVNKAYSFLQYAGALVSAALTTLAAASIGKIILGSALLFTASAPAVLITLAVSLVAAFVTYKGFQHLYNKRREEMVNKLYEDVLKHAKSLSPTSKASSAAGVSRHAATTAHTPSTEPATVFTNHVGDYNPTNENKNLGDDCSLHAL